MQHIVSFSTGLSSAIAVERVLQRYGADNTTIVFMDTTIEDKDNYRFMADCQKRWNKKIIVLCEGRNPYEIARDQQIIPNSRIAPCTFKLKIELFRKWLKKMQDSLGDITIHIGYDFTELHRCGPTESAYNTKGWSVDFPLLWKPYEMRPYSQVVKEDWKIKPPRMYAMGYTHANCGGLCVKQGQGDWLRTLINFPERFRMAEEWERTMRENQWKKGLGEYAILRNQSNGEIKPLTLEKLRQRYEQERIEQPLLFKLDSKSACVHCGVGNFIEEN